MSAPIRALPRGTRLIGTPSRRVALRVTVSSSVVTLVALGLALGLALLSLTLGAVEITPSDVVSILGGGGTLIERDAVLGTRLPRAVTGLAVGACLALSGAVLQRLAGNPLVSPDVIGINAGASLGALAVLTVLGRSGWATVGGALAGALAAAVLILAVASGRRPGQSGSGPSGMRLVLVGIGVSAMFSAVISFLLTRSDINRALSASVWLTGSLANRGGIHVATSLLGVAVGAVALMVLARRLRLLELGAELAATLGGGLNSRLGTGTVPLLVVAVVLAALATAAAGPIGFVALVAPQVTRRLVSERRIALVPSAAVGALLVVGADLAARLLFAPAELPVGVLTAVLGAPALIALLVGVQRRTER